jgi:putative DNA primase/helicase
MPDVLADYMSKNIDAFYSAASYYVYEDGVYRPRDDLTAAAMVRELMLTQTIKTRDISDAENQWRMLVQKEVEELNPDPFIINVKNGLYNATDGSFAPHSVEYLSTMRINANYDPAAQCPLFLSVLDDILPETEHGLLQEIFWYFLIPVNKAQKAFVFAGAANAGKSTLLSVVQDVLLGRENVSNIPWQS